MEREKHYSEEEAVEKVQSGEYGSLEYATHISREYEEEYYIFCQLHNLPVGDKSAETFIAYKDEELAAAVERGDA